MRGVSTINSDQLAAPLTHGAAELGVPLSAAQTAQLLAYLQLLVKWNRAYNLTAVRNPADMLPKHLLDSLAVLPHLPSTPLLDVGAGAGLPGIPIAIMRPEQRIVVLDGNSKKVRFMKQAILELGLRNITAVHSRIEAYRPPADLGHDLGVGGFSIIISRAFSSIADFITLAGQKLAHDGHMLAMKGRYPEDELQQLPPGWQATATQTLRVPELTGERCLVTLQPTTKAC